MKQEKTMAAGLIKTTKMHVEKEGKSNKKAKKDHPLYLNQNMPSPVMRLDPVRTIPFLNMNLIRSRQCLRAWFRIQDGHTLAQAMSSIRKRKNLQKEESRKKRTKQPVQEPPRDPATVSLGNDESNAESASLFVKVHEQYHKQPHQQPPEEEEPPHEQPHQVCQQQQPQQELIDISSNSEVELEPTPNRVLIPKAEPNIVSSPRDRLEAPSQSLVEVV
ncbi:hypothetical protein PIB30_042007 [Stylosanthes scabra]|uniref:Uncharacterized protein n=1 Tax=Stylosanthes scabra TaxID=79078 RepID=A0ABU6RF79_9FABA|nr:hypothetical protein [Stylosanthes scabra]